MFEASDGGEGLQQARDEPARRHRARSADAEHRRLYGFAGAQRRPAHQRHSGHRVDVAGRRCGTQGAAAGRERGSFPRISSLAKTSRCFSAMRRVRRLTCHDAGNSRSSTSTTRNRSAMSRRATCGRLAFPSSKLRRAPRPCGWSSGTGRWSCCSTCSCPISTAIEVCRYVKQKWPEVMVLMTSATFTTSEQRHPRPGLRRRQLSGAAGRAARAGSRGQRAFADSALRGSTPPPQRNSRKPSQGADRRAVQRDHGAQGERRSHAHVRGYDLHPSGLHDAGRRDAGRQPRLAGGNRKPPERRRRQAVLGHCLVYRNARDARDHPRGGRPRRGGA